MAADAALIMAEGQTNRIYRIHGELAQKLAEEKAKGSALANAKNFSQFKQKYASLYKELDQESVKKFLRWDQSIKTNNMRRMLSQSAFVRDGNYKGGIKK